MTGITLRQSMTTRQGRKVPRMIYRQAGPEPADDDPVIGLVDTPELAELIVAAVNERGLLPPCPACGCTLPDDPDRRECGCDAGCNDGPWPPGVNALIAAARKEGPRT